MTELRQRQPREVDEAYLEKVRKLPCVINTMGCDYYMRTTDPHHVKSKGVLGGDRQTIPLCAKHHRELHDIGRMTFATKYGLDYEQLIRETNEKVNLV